MSFEKIALHVPTILLPKPGTDLTKWAVVACDQYTSQPEYWEQVRQLTGGSRSTLDLIFPEVYLESKDQDQIVRNINRNMKRYPADGDLVPQKPGFILVDRKTSKVPSRKGLIVALDLECYDYSKESRSLIRATEGTIPDRLPPRIKVREKAAIELTHIMVLIDDPAKTVIEPLFEKDPEKIYDFELMMNGGHVKGYRIDGENSINQITENIAKLAGPDYFKKKNGICGSDVLLYAMGDGNHSFATAKAIWERLKTGDENPDALADHPARYALVELVNLHDEGLEFEPIHRVIFSVNAAEMLRNMEKFYGEQGSRFICKTFETQKELQNASARLRQENSHIISFVTADMYGVLMILGPNLSLATATLQSFLDNYLKDRPEAKIDYIHGADVVAALGSKPGNIGFYLPPISKQVFFKTIIKDGPLPRKTFSLGAADEKRFYLECRQIAL